MVYVDAPVWPLGRMLMCHMVADTLDELHAMADRIGVARRHFQNKPGGTPHYDICKAKRALAVRDGAKEVDKREMVRHMRWWRGECPKCRVKLPTKCGPLCAEQRYPKDS